MLLHLFINHLTSSSVGDSHKGSGKVGGQVDKAAEVAAGDGPVEEHPDAQEGDGVAHVTLDVS